jgi:plastocyanin
MLMPRSTTWRRAVSIAPLLAAAMALTACGTRSHASGVAGASTAVTTGQQVTATETEFKIQLSTTTLKPGATTIVAENKGHVAHSLEINGPGVSDQRIQGTIPPGSSMQLHVVLQNGSYEIFCPIAGHKNLGMDVHVTVGSGGGMNGGGGGTTTGSTPSGGGY